MHKPSCYLLDCSFNTNAIVFDNTPWRPGREINMEHKMAEEDERKLKNLATRIMSNGVEVLVKDKEANTKPEQTKYMEIKTIQPSTPSHMFMSNLPQIDKRIDEDEELSKLDLIEPSELSHAPCTSSSCSCSHTKTEGLKTKYTNLHGAPSSVLGKYPMKATKFGSTIMGNKPTHKDQLDKTQYPYEYENNLKLAPTDKIVEKYTEVMNEYSDEKDSGSVEESELLTNEQAPRPPKPKVPEKNKPDKVVQKPNKNKFVGDLLKLGSLGIKGLSQLAPVFEKMTGGLIKRYDTANKTMTTSTTTLKPAKKLTSYNVDKRVDSDVELKNGQNFPIYIPVDELETSESQNFFSNVTLQQNLAWAAEHNKNSKSHNILPPKFVHESPLVNGGIPISPGEIITANSDVIVGKPAVGGPLTLAASGIKLHNHVKPPVFDSLHSGSEHHTIQEIPLMNEQMMMDSKVDDSFDLRPPNIPKEKPIRNLPPPISNYEQFSKKPKVGYKYPLRPTSNPNVYKDNMMKTEYIKSSSTVLSNHGRPAFLDYIPSLAKPNKKLHHNDFEMLTDEEVPDNSPSSSEISSTRVKTEPEYPLNLPETINKPFLVDIQPSKVANVLIPHGSTTALVFAGSSEPHKTGDYVDDPLPYPEPGYFGSFSIDAPQMTNVHVAPNSKPFATNNNPSYAESYKSKDQTYRNDIKQKWKDFKRPGDHSKIPPPTSNFESYVQVGPQITVYNPDAYKGDFESYNQIKSKKEQKLIIDKDYENYLAVPPPPPPSKQNFDKNKPFQQLPIVHTKPMQDMKIFLNIQHPVPHGPVNSAVTPKITSEIYFAEQAHNGKQSPTYTIKMPPRDNSYEKHYYNQQNIYNAGANNGPSHSYQEPPSYSTHVLSSNSNKTILTKHTPQNENTYSVTLNTATNVASNVADTGLTGSSESVSLGTEHFGNENTNIPIGTNFAIKVDGGSSIYDSNSNNENTKVFYSNPSPVPEVTIGNKTWNEENSDERFVFEAHEENKNQFHNNDNNEDENPADNISTPNEIIPSIAPSLNSHANFPMTNGQISTIQNDVITENYEDVTEHKRPAKLIPNLPTNSHGWYSSVFKEDALNNITNINVEVTTRKVIPLIHDYDKNTSPNFGQKISSIGKPPTEFWSQNTAKIHTNNFNIGKPFSKSPNTKPPTLGISTKPFITEASINYIPSNIGHIDQPVYDIPIRDNSDETTTAKIEKTYTEKTKPVYENAEEVIDGEEEIVSEGDLDGEVSQESIKVPVITASTEETFNTKTTVSMNLLKDEVLPTENVIDKNKNSNFVNFDPNTQTEKPFTYNNTNTFHSNNMRPIYNYNNSNTKPRPFTISNLPPMIDHQLQQPHWQINQLMINSTNMSYEEGLDLNIGEEISTISSTKVTPSPKLPFRHNEAVNKYKRPRPNFGRPNNGVQNNNSSNIITSTVHIRDKKPLVIKDSPEKSTLPTFTITSNSRVNSSSIDIIDLSPPPPTMDYNFKPSTNDETIMGMSPPPPRTPPQNRIPPRIPPTSKPMPIRTPPYRTKPPRTPPPRVSTQRPTRKPIRDDISTYRPPYNILNNIKRPSFDQDQPSPVLLPPPNTDLPVISSINDKPSSVLSGSHIIFPTPISSGWLTSSGVEFSSSFNFAPTPVYFPSTTESTKQVTSDVQDYKISTSSEEPYSYEDSSSERETETSSEEMTYDNVTPEHKKPVKISSKEILTSTSKKPTTESNDSDFSETEYKDVSTERISVIPLGYKNRTRKPYVPHDKKNSSTNKYTYKPQTRSPPTVKPLTRPEILYPSRPTPIRKIVQPVTKQTSTTSTESVIESSETFVDDDFVKPTDILNIEKVSKISRPDVTIITSNVPVSTTLTTIEESSLVKEPLHHAGNEIKISDEIIPTKTEFRTTVITLTKTLSEPPKTVSSIGYVNLTHTLTVTHTETSLLSTSDGAVTQTLMITNTQTSTIVDVVTEVHTQVQPTTIIETVTRHIPVPQVEPTPVQTQEVVVPTKTSIALDDITMSSEESENFIIKDSVTTDNVQKVVTEDESDNDTFLIVMNKSQNGGKYTPANTPEVDTGDYDITRNEQVNSNGVSQVLFGEILLAGTPYLETSNVVHPTGVGFGKECQPDCKASRNERCQRIDGIMKCVCRPGFARMFPDRPCKPTYTYSVRLALGSKGNEKLKFQKSLSDNSSKEYHDLALATHEGINRMIMQSDLRDVYHGVHITGFQPVEMKSDKEQDFQGVMNDFYVQLSDNAHESRLKEVIEKYLRNNNYSLGGTDVHAAGDIMEKLEVSDFDECTSGQFHDCSEHAQCFNLRGTYTCSCLEGFADLSVNKLYPGRICSAEPVGCERCNYHGACYSRDDRRVLCECFQWYAGSTCHINLKVVLISLVVAGALLTAVLAACAVVACTKRSPRTPRPPPRSVLTCIQGMPNLHQGAVPPKQRADRRALINERGDSGDNSSLQNASLPYMPSAKRSSARTKKCMMSAPPAHEAPPPPPAPAVMIPRARLHPHDTRDNIARKKSLELSNEAKLISYLESGAVTSANDEMRRKHSMESSYSANKDRHNKQGALVSAGFKVSTTIRPDEQMMKEEREKERERERDRDRDDLSSINKADLEAEMSRFDSLRKPYSQEDMSEWTDGERRLGELTLSEARSVGGTLPASTGRAASSTRLTHQEANTMAERDLGSTFLLPHVHLYKPEITSDVSEFDSL